MSSCSPVPEDAGFTWNSVPTTVGDPGGEADRDSGPSPSAADVFGARSALVERFAEMLAGPGQEQGVIGPREVPRLWERHLVNSAVIGAVVPEGVRVLDVGSGAGLPGIPLAIARPDLEVTLLEPMARRVAWLETVVQDLGLDVRVVRGRAEERETRRRCGEFDVVTARAVAPLGRLVGWTMPLVRPGGLLAAMKGSSAEDEVARDGKLIRAAGGEAVSVQYCGVGDAATRVVLVHRTTRRVATPPGAGRAGRGRKDHTRG